MLFDHFLVYQEILLWAERCSCQNVKHNANSRSKNMSFTSLYKAQTHYHKEITYFSMILM